MPIETIQENNKLKYFILRSCFKDIWAHRVKKHKYDIKENIPVNVWAIIYWNYYYFKVLLETVLGIL